MNNEKMLYIIGYLFGALGIVSLIVGVIIDVIEIHIMGTFCIIVSAIVLIGGLHYFNPIPIKD